MQLVRLGEPGSERPFVRADDGTTYELGGLTADIDGRFLAADGIARAAAALAAGELPRVSENIVDSLRLGAPVAQPGKVVCIGMNYRRHAEETGATPPAEPVVFMKAPDVVVGPGDDVLIPRGSVSTDWEVELGVVIGKTARYLGSVDEALEHVAGYVVSNDVSERDLQFRTGQWDKGKSCENFNPLGPALIPASEVPDPQDLGLRLWVNGEKKQDSSTKDMIFTVAEIVHHLSQVMVLRPGDLINTGTPEGVALGQPDPKPYLRDGDVIELEIDGLGRQRQTARQA
ncbi:fumarylacetoacetate hydrolase family protein [Amycolatopsis sp. NPDC051045]|uniref:fumarylacetoacetate hydrolase family protein n=1 Tax=Amycolatopsis sp. NPDC051045 TaxID=3156922 RepID=UPI0034282D0E